MSTSNSIYFTFNSFVENVILSSLFAAVVLTAKKLRKGEQDYLTFNSFVENISSLFAAVVLTSKKLRKGEQDLSP